MSLSDIQFISTSTSSLSHGSFLTEEDLSFYTEDLTSLNFPFGKSEKDYVKFGVYDFDGRLISSSLIYSVGNYASRTSSYYNVFNEFNEYSYSEYQTDWVIVGKETKSLFFDVSKEINNLSIGDGNYTIYIELGRNIIGSSKASDTKLILDTISTDRTEITVVPKTLRGTVSEINAEYDRFSNEEIQIKEIADDIIFEISSPEIYTLYSNAASQNVSGSSYLKFYYSFKKDVDVVAFLTDIYYGVRKGSVRANGQYATNDILGVYDQFKNWLYQNYEVGYTFQFIRDYYYSLFVYIVDQELNRISNKKPEEYPQIIEFLQTIFYNNIFYPAFFAIEAKYNIDLSGYFKYYLNIEGKQSMPIVNRKIVESADPRFYNRLALKLTKALPSDIELGHEMWVTNDFGFLPIVQNIYYYTKRVINTIPLRGPNFLIKIENEGNSTEAFSMETLLAETGSLFDELDQKIKGRASQFIDTTDYRSFENFVNFSSANFRTQAFEQKRSKIEALYDEIQKIDVALTNNPNDVFYIKNKKDANEEIDALEAGMDGYERFLYNNPIWYEEHTRDYGGHSSASLYDINNRNSLINNLPQFLVDDVSQNGDYVKFVGMIGHFFDNISLAAKQFTEKNNICSSPNEGTALNVVSDMLASLGWDVEISKDNLPLILSSFSKSDFDIDSPLYLKARTFSEEERNQVIWKRLLNTLPYIYKTKGTEASLNALISCFGVPKNIIKIKEYGGIQNVGDLTDKSLYIIEDVKYEPYFSGSGEYFKLDWTGSAKSVEFSFRFDPAKVNNEGEIFRLANCSDNWVVGITKEKGTDWGKVFFSISGSITKTVLTNRAPVFDGSSYHVLLRRNNVDASFNATSSLNEYPTKYDILLQKSQDDRITFYSSASIVLSGSYNNSFESGSYLYIGNYNQNTASFSIDPEAFFGNIDDIRVWESAISNERFVAHTLNRSGYDLETPQAMVYENLYRISFERPIDLYDPVPYGVELKNLAFRKDFPYFYAVNFYEVSEPLVQVSQCDPAEGPLFPFQFDKKDVRLTMNLPDYGSSKFRSNKINYLEQELATNLNSETRASYKTSELVSVDSNKLGIFFSPSEIQNMEIIKFFGEIELGDLVGDPSDVYKRSYEKFEKFKQIFYDQGFGTIDYSFFMNIIRFYFDKAMFKYIKGIIPARAKLVDGILIEPTILERPKLEIKPIKKENISQKTGVVDTYSNISAFNLNQNTGIVNYNLDTGVSILNDINHVMFDSDFSEFGFGIYSEKGLTYYNEKFYRCDIIKVKKKYSYYRSTVLDENTLPSDENTAFNREVQTVEKYYEKINLVGFPILNNYPMTVSMWSPPISAGESAPNIYFKGRTSFNIGYLGWRKYSVNTAHSIDGTITGSIFERIAPTTQSYGVIYSPIKASGSYDPKVGYSVVYDGLFNLDENNNPTFDGSIYINPPVYTTATIGPEFYLTLSSDKPENSIFSEFIEKTTGPLFARLTQGVAYQKSLSLAYKPSSSALLDGYYQTHYKYKKQQFSKKEINSFDNMGRPFKWAKGSQNKKTTIDPKTGLLNNSDPVEIKTV